MDNPFKYAEVVTDKEFTDREDDIKRLISNAISGQSAVIYSPRRLGKTSMIMEAFRRLRARDDIICVYIDIYGVTSERDLAQRIVSQLVVSAYTTVERIRKGIKDVLIWITPQVIIEKDTVKIRLVWDRQDAAQNLEEAFDLPQKIAEKRKKKVVVAFDEFQDVNAIGGAKIEKMMRSKFQHHKDVAYIFTGSKIGMIHQMFGDYDRAFYKFGEFQPLGKIEDRWLTTFIKKRFASTKRGVDKDTIDEILAIVGGRPYFMQQLCHRTWDVMKGKRATKGDVRAAVGEIIKDGSDFYTAMFDDLTRAQRALLVGMCKDAKLSVYSKDFASNYEMTTSAIQKAWSALENKRIIEGGEISDVFFREWVRQRF